MTSPAGPAAAPERLPENPPPGEDEGSPPTVAPWRTPTRIFLRPIGSPMPFGFLGLAVATLVLAGLDLGWLPTAEQHAVALVLLAFAFPAQILASVLGFLARDTVVGSGIGLTAVAWLTLGLLLLTSPEGTRSRTTALFLFVVAAALVPSILVAGLGRLFPCLVMTAVAARFALTGAWEWLGGTGLEHAAGWEGLALCVLSLYTALALELEDSQRRTILPVGRHARGREAMTSGLPGEVAHVAHEAGVRSRL